MENPDIEDPDKANILAQVVTAEKEGHTIEAHPVSYFPKIGLLSHVIFLQATIRRSIENLAPGEWRAATTSCPMGEGDVWHYGPFEIEWENKKLTVR